MVLETKDTLSKGYMHYIVATSLQMSDEQKN